MVSLERDMLFSHFEFCRAACWDKLKFVFTIKRLFSKLFLVHVYMNFSLNFEPWKTRNKFRGISVASCTAVHGSRLLYLGAAPFRERRMHPGACTYAIRRQRQAAH